MLWAAAAVVILTACGGSNPGDPDAASPYATPTADPGPRLGTFDLTYYWITSEDEFPGTADTAIYTPSCAVLATVPSAFADDLDLEGTGRLADGRVVNVDGSCSCARSPCYAEVDADH